MRTERAPRTLGLLFLGVVLLIRPSPLLAQEVVGDGWVNITGLGPVDLNTLPPEISDNIRTPDMLPDDTEPYSGDLPASRDLLSDDLLPPAALPALSAESLLESAGSAAQPIPELPPSKVVTREEMLQRMYDERAFPNKTIPEGAYQKAWDEIRNMQQADPVDPIAPPVRKDEPLSWYRNPRHLLAKVLDFLSP